MDNGHSKQNTRDDIVSTGISQPMAWCRNVNLSKYAAFQTDTDSDDSDDMHVYHTTYSYFTPPMSKPTSPAEAHQCSIFPPSLTQRSKQNPSSVLVFERTQPYDPNNPKPVRYQRDVGIRYSGFSYMDSTDSTENDQDHEDDSLANIPEVDYISPGPRSLPQMKATDYKYIFDGTAQLPASQTLIAYIAPPVLPKASQTHPYSARGSMSSRIRNNHAMQAPGNSQADNTMHGKMNLHRNAREQQGNDNEEDHHIWHTKTSDLKLRMNANERDPSESVRSRTTTDDSQDTSVEDASTIEKPGKGIRGRRVGKEREGGVERVHRCPVEGCFKEFKRSEHLKRHTRSIHTLEKPFICTLQFCGKRFSRSDNLSQHLRIHRIERDTPNKSERKPSQPRSPEPEVVTNQDK